MVFMQGCKGCGHLLNQHGDDGCRYRDDINGSCGCDEYEAVLAVSMDKRVEEIRKRNVEERYGAPKEEWAHISDIDYLLAALDQRTRVLAAVRDKFDADWRSNQEQLDQVYKECDTLQARLTAASEAILGLRQTNDADPRYFCWCAKP